MVDSWDDGDSDDGKDKPKKHDEFDCPSCNANNPWPDGLHEGDEINCHYCGTSFLVRIKEGGKLKLKEI
jgi:hypothetical protein